MRIVRIADLDNYIDKEVAKPLRLKDGRVYVNSNVKITKGIVNALKRNIDSLAHRFITIHTEDSEGIDLYDDTIGDELKFEAKHKIDATLKQFSSQNTESVKKLVTEIIDNLYSNPNTIFGTNILFLAGGEDHAVHSLNVAILSAIMGLNAGYNKNDLEKIVLGAALHDIGMAKIDSRLLDINYVYNNKEDYLEMQRHPLEGYNLVKNKISVMSKRIILMHHVWENFSASYNSDLDVYMSYPHKLNNTVLDGRYKDLSISIVQTADVFEAMTNKETGYKSRKTKVEALEYIRSMKYVQFGEGADYLVNCITPYEAGTEVVLNNREKAIVMRYTSLPHRPVIKFLTGDDKGEIVNLMDKRYLTLNIVSAP